MTYTKLKVELSTEVRAVASNPTGGAVSATMTCAVILAAGKSRRMNRQKLLLPWGKKTVIAHVADEVLSAASIAHVVVVVGDNSAAVMRALEGRNVHFAVNPNPEGDMLSSIRCGLQASPAQWPAYAIVLGDQPPLRAAWLDRMAAALASSGKGLVVPVCQGRRGHPILFAGRYRGMVLRGLDGVGLRGLLREHANDVLEVPFEDTGVLCDLDTPEDYARALRQSSSPSRSI